MTTYSISVIDYPNAKGTSLIGGDASGAIAGNESDANGVNHAFVDHNGAFSLVEGQSSTAVVTGIGSSGAIAGNFSDQAGAHGYLDVGGSITTINGPGATFTNTAGVSNDGRYVVGSYSNAGGSHAYYFSNGTVHDISGPSGGTGATVAGVNNSGQVVGTYSQGGVTNSFVYDSQTNTYSTFQVVAGRPTVVTGVNDAGLAVGYYQGTDNQNHVFERNAAGTVTTLTSIPASVSGKVSVNNSGQIGGTYTSNAVHGFVYDPVTNTTTTIDVPGLNTANVTGINDQGQLFGTAANITANPGFGNGFTFGPPHGFVASPASTVTITSAAEASNQAVQTITGTAMSATGTPLANQVVTLTDNGDPLTSVTTDQTGHYSVQVTLPNQGQNSIVASIVDKNGAASSSTTVVDTLDSVAPTVTLTSLSEASDTAAQTITGTVTSGGSASVAGQTVKILDNGVVIATGTTDADGKFKLDVTLPYKGRC